MAEITWSLDARTTLRETFEFIALNSEQNAENFLNRVQEAVGLLATHPRLGARVEQYHRVEIRETLVDGYRVLYRLHGEDVEVVLVVHGSRPLPRRAPK